MSLLGVHLTVLAGPTVPTPLPPDARRAALMRGPVSAFGSCGPPRRIEPARSTSRSTKSSWMPGAASTRVAAVQS